MVLLHKNTNVQFIKDTYKYLYSIICETGACASPPSISPSMYLLPTIIKMIFESEIGECERIIINWLLAMRERLPILLSLSHALARQLSFKYTDRVCFVERQKFYQFTYNVPNICMFFLAKKNIVFGFGGSVEKRRHSVHKIATDRKWQHQWRRRWRRRWRRQTE